MFGVLSPSVNPGCLEKSKRAPSAPYHICYAGLSTGPEHARNPAPSRRAFALVLGQVLLSAGAASAIDLENLSQLQKQQLSKALSTPIDFLRARQRAGGGAKLLAPIRASRKRLQAAETIIKQVNIYDPQTTLFRDALSIVRGASLNCYNFDLMEGDSVETAASIVQRNLKIGDACTFRLISKNVTSLLPLSKKALSKETNSQLDELIMSYEMLDSGLARAWMGDMGAAERIPDLMQFTLSHTTSFETCIERCLGLPPSSLAPSVLNILLPGTEVAGES